MFSCVQVLEFAHKINVPHLHREKKLPKHYIKLLRAFRVYCAYLRHER